MPWGLFSKCVVKKRIYYIIPLILLLLGLLGPAIYMNKESKSNAPTVAAGGVPALSAPAGNSSPGSAAGNASVDPGTAAQPSLEKAPVKPPSPQSAPDAVVSDTVMVNIAVLGKSGEMLFGPASVKVAKNSPRGANALSALEATGLSYEMSAKWPGFVEAVAGQRGKGQSGWMYKVNEEIPLVTADKKPVTTGDKVIWWYSKSMDAPPPTWDRLAKTN